MDGPGNGQGELDGYAAYAESLGITFFNSACNYAGVQGDPYNRGGYYRFTWSDTDSDGWMNFPDGEEYLGLECSSNTTVMGLRWSDWDVSPKTDYGISAVDQFGNLLWQSNSNQTTADPMEARGWNVACPAGQEWASRECRRVRPGQWHRW